MPLTTDVPIPEHQLAVQKIEDRRLGVGNLDPCISENQLDTKNSLKNTDAWNIFMFIYSFTTLDPLQVNPVAMLLIHFQQIMMPKMLWMERW